MASRPTKESAASAGVGVLPTKPLEFVVVGIGSSAGGLEAVRDLLDKMPSDSGMAFILIQHLDPTHDSHLVEILVRHTKMSIVQAVDGMQVEGDHIYVIPPGAYLSVSAGILQLSTPTERHGARLPFDFTLHSLAEAYGPNAVCVILSGNGADGSAGLKSVTTKGGLVIAQSPNEAAYDGMPKSAIATGCVDLVLPVAEIAEALIKYQLQMAETDALQYLAVEKNPPDCLPDIIALLRSKTAHDYTLYKVGTLQRRIERRMTLASMRPGDMIGYLEMLRKDDGEVVQLAKDLMIHVTGFFRDPSVFALLSTKIIPDLVNAHPAGQPIRIWSVGCSTGEEAYSLAIVFQEALLKAGRDNKLQVFASDADPDSISTAREGFYSAAIEADVSKDRLKQFFSKEEGGYRVLPQLRTVVVFTIQDVLADPPFSRLDLVSCRNLLIYLGPEAQAKAIALFHFALVQRGILLLGLSESAGAIAGRFDVVSKSERIYRQTGRRRTGDFGFSPTGWAGMRVLDTGGTGAQIQGDTTLMELCKQWGLESYGLALVLLNDKNECLYKLGPVERYLTVSQGPPTLDVLAMASENIRATLRSALQQASQLQKAGKAMPLAPVTTTAKYTNAGGERITTRIEVRSRVHGGKPVFLIGFVDGTKHRSEGEQKGAGANARRLRETELELEATRMELESVLHNFERSGEEQRAIDEEASSVNEEYQSANEELLTSKEELQSLNEELTALNSQLQETLDRQRTTANDLQNVLYSTDIATLFLDAQLNIRFFTPTTRSLFNIIPGDIGRPLSDLHSLALDPHLPADAARVLKDMTPVDREIETSKGLWFLRRVMPYLTDEKGVDGVVITFADITERNRVARDLEAAKQQADLANIAKTRFLSAASHDLRQPLQSLSFLQGLLAKEVDGEKASKLVVRLDEMIETMSGMLNTMLDINQFESGMVRVEKVSVPVNDIFDRLKNEFVYHAQARGLTFRTVSCSAVIVTDPALLEQLIRNLLSNAIKYTQAGGVVLGCRHHSGSVKIEVVDSGIGIGENEQTAIFEEYYQVDNAARERSRGLGLGLSIVKRLADVLDHHISVRSRIGKGSVFSIEVNRLEAPLAANGADARAIAVGHVIKPAATETLKSLVLVIEDDAEVRGLLQILLESNGHRVVVAGDGPSALLELRQDGFIPDVIVADYNLPNVMTGVEAARQCSTYLKRNVPVIILTGDVSTATLRDIAVSGCIQMKKPVKPQLLTRMIQSLLDAAQPASAHPAPISSVAAKPVLIYAIDDDSHIRDGIKSVLEAEGFGVSCFGDAETFLAGYEPDRQACILIDAGLPGMSGLDLLKTLRAAGYQPPAIIITGNGDVAMAVDAMKAGATDFLEKPVRPAELIQSIQRAIALSLDSASRHIWQASAARHLGDLTARQRQIMHMVLAGHPSKNIAIDLGISQRTVENHRASIMAKTGAKSLPALARMAMDAGEGEIRPGLVNTEPE